MAQLFDKGNQELLNLQTFEAFPHLLLKPPECGPALGIKQVTPPAPVIVGRAEPRNGNAKAVFCLQEFCPVKLQLLAGRCVYQTSTGLAIWSK